MSPTRVLVVDDDPDIRSVLELTLEHAGFEVIHARDGAEALVLARTLRPDVVLLDVMMPGLDGFAVLRELRLDVRTINLPVLLLTARTQPRDAAAALDAGADDYITKPFDGEEVVARIHATVRRAGQQRGSNPLTGLPGNERITTELRDRIERSDPTALLYVDLDDFKPYNDHYGFLRGDEVIQRLAGLIIDVVREFDGDTAFVGHVGGDDFVVIVDPAHAEPVAAAICDRFDALAPSLYDEDDAEAGSIEVADRRGVPQRYGLLSLSIGVASTDRREVAHREELVTAATEMKRFAKSRSRDRSRYAFDRRSEGSEMELEVDLP
jgi:diguanylate cyclase (GGDEF)-like protein